MNLRCFMLMHCSVGNCQCNNSGEDGRNYRMDDEDPILFLDAEFDALSPEEKQRVHNDLYGVEVNPIVETESFLQQKLEEMETEIQSLRDTEKRAYVVAMQQAEAFRRNKNTNNSNDYYVLSPQFKIMFLRAEKFQSKLAALRITRFFQEKQEMFGVEKLSSKITQADLNKQDMRALYSGAWYNSDSSIDGAGRLIFLSNRFHFMDYDVITVKRVVYYFVQSAIEENETSQKKGVVFVDWNTRHLSTREIMSLSRFIALSGLFFEALPIRVQGSHCCYSNPYEHVLHKMFLAIAPKNCLPKTMLHYRLLYEEFAFVLADYGIDINVLPLTGREGDIDLVQLREYLEERKKKE